MADKNETQEKKGVVLNIPDEIWEKIARKGERRNLGVMGEVNPSIVNIGRREEEKLKIVL